MNKRELQKIDPVKPQVSVDRGSMEEGISPMDPPSSFEPPAKSKYPQEKMRPFFQDLMREHDNLKKEMTNFKQILKLIQQTGQITLEQRKGFKEFFTHFEADFIEHNRKEEFILFPILKKRLLEAGEHSPTKKPVTGVDVLQDEHIQALQLATLCYKNLDLLDSINELTSRRKVVLFIVSKGLDLIELMELHIFREDEIIFGLAHELLSNDEMNDLHGIKRPQL